jgi:hypothetical protein
MIYLVNITLTMPALIAHTSNARLCISTALYVYTYIVCIHMLHVVTKFITVRMCKYVQSKRTHLYRGYYWSKLYFN